MRINPYERMNDAERTPIKTNFHAHAGVCVPNDCGELPMAEVVEAYRRAKYGALAISNHNRYLDPGEFECISVLNAVEYSKHPHMGLVGTKQYHDVPHQQAIDLALAEGAFVILNHPNWIRKEYWPIPLLLELTGYTGIEIMNPVIDRLEGSGLAVDIWDAILSSGKKVWGFGNDDFHLWHDLGRSYNIIYSKSGSYPDIKAAVQEGCFYVSSGLSLHALSLGVNSIEVEAGFFVNSYIDTFEYALVGMNGKVIDSDIGKRVVLHYESNEPYVRVEVRARNGAQLFLQPMILT